MAQLSFPPFTAYALPRERRPRGPAALASLLVHAAIALAVLWRGAVLFQPGAGGPGAPGGGGGGGRQAVSWFAVLPASAPQAREIPAAPAVTVPAVLPPDPAPSDLVTPPPPAVPAASAAAPAPTAGATGGSGQGPGSGGGTGTGAGTGVGAHTGPDSGGQGGYILPAYAKGIIVPPDCARGAFQLRFWVEVDGHVSRVEVDPPPKDARCRREMHEQLRAYQFRPATTRDGRPVASVFQMQYAH